MEAQNQISVRKQVIKTKNKVPGTALKDVKTDGTISGAEKAIAVLKKNGVAYFETLDPEAGTKTTYKACLSGENYEKKVVKI